MFTHPLHFWISEQNWHWKRGNSEARTAPRYFWPCWTCACSPKMWGQTLPPCDVWLITGSWGLFGAWPSGIPSPTPWKSQLCFLRPSFTTDFKEEEHWLLNKGGFLLDPGLHTPKAEGHLRVNFCFLALLQKCSLIILLWDLDQVWSVPWGDNQGQCLQCRKTSPWEMWKGLLLPFSQFSVLFLNLIATKLQQAKHNIPLVLPNRWGPGNGFRLPFPF